MRIGKYEEALCDCLFMMMKFVCIFVGLGGVYEFSVWLIVEVARFNLRMCAGIDLKGVKRNRKIRRRVSV